MKPLYTKEQFNSAKSTDKLPCECYYCKLIFYKQKKEIKCFLAGNKNRSVKYCSKTCNFQHKKNRIKVSCLNCKFIFEKYPSEIKKSKNNFCSNSCNTTYQNTHKVSGNKRSKLEIWLEEQISNFYPNLKIDYNQKTAINSELDIYIPSLNLAFELNGIFHYEPIYGVNKLQQIQKNDKSKSKACHDAKIDLCTIDVSAQKYVKPSTSQKYLNIINNIIKERLLII